MKLDYETARTLLHEFADAKPDHIARQCVYGEIPYELLYGEDARARTRVTGAQPSCLVGHVLHKVMAPAEWDELVNGYNSIEFSAVVRDAPELVQVDEKAVWLLNTAQSVQDEGRPWREAADVADETIALGEESL